MKIENGIIYSEVTYPKDVKEIYQQAKAQSLRGYSAKSVDGRFFKWNPALNKAEVTGADVIYFDGTKNNVILAVEEKKKEEAPVVKDSQRVANFRDKIQNYKNQVEALSASLASSNTKVVELEKQLADRDAEIEQLKAENKELNAEFEALQNDLEELEAL